MCLIQKMLTQTIQKELIKNSKMSCQTHVTREQISIRNITCHVNIKDPKYNTKRGAPTRFVPDDTMCHCGESFDTPGEVAQHLSQDHPANCTWVCFICGSTTSKREHIWKHVRTQHLNLYVHICQFNKRKNCQKFGNDELTTVWTHMDMKHGLKNPLGCPFCKETFSGKAAQMSHINTCEEPKPPRRTKDFVCPTPKCGKRSVDEVSLANHIADHDCKQFIPSTAYKEYMSICAN